MGRPGSLFQNAETFAQAGDDLPYQLGFIHFEISSVILEYNPFKHLRKAPYRSRLGLPEAGIEGEDLVKHDDFAGSATAPAQSLLEQERSKISSRLGWTGNWRSRGRACAG